MVCALKEAVITLVIWVLEGAHSHILTLHCISCSVMPLVVIWEIPQLIKVLLLV